MTSLLIRLFILILILWLLRRFLARILGSPRPQPSAAPGPVAKNMVKDPVCGMYLDARLAVQIEGNQETVYFCSEECKSKYLKKSPEGKETGAVPPL